MLSRAQTTIILPITDGSVPKAVPFLVAVSQEEGGLTKNSHILAHQIRVIDESRIIEKLGRVTADTMRKVEAALKFTLNIEQD